MITAANMDGEHLADADPGALKDLILSLQVSFAVSCLPLDTRTLLLLFSLSSSRGAVDFVSICN